MSMNVCNRCSYTLPESGQGRLMRADTPWGVLCDDCAFWMAGQEYRKVLAMKDAAQQILNNLLADEPDIIGACRIANRMRGGK